MNNEKEIERMAKAMQDGLSQWDSETHDFTVLLAEILCEKGYGNVKQAVKEFAEKLKRLCNKRCKLFQGLCDNCSSREKRLSYEYMKLRNEWITMEQEINNLIIELYGGKEC